MNLLAWLPIKFAVDVTHWNSFKIGSFKEQFVIKLQDASSFWLGAALNSRKTEYGRIRLDANPNKVAQHKVFHVILSFLIGHTRLMNRTVRRFDLAVDIPIPRLDVFLVKDNRAYIERRHGQEWTQYLGANPSTVGRVKLYNKTVEAKLDYPLTRLELTMDPEMPYDKIIWPVVYTIKTMQITLDEMKVTETERFILNALLQGCGSLNQLGRKTRVKMENLLSSYVSMVEVSKSEYNAILEQVRGYIFPETLQILTNKDKPSQFPAWVRKAEKLYEISQKQLPF